MQVNRTQWDLLAPLVIRAVHKMWHPFILEMWTMDLLPRTFGRVYGRSALGPTVQPPDLPYTSWCSRLLMYCKWCKKWASTLPTLLDSSKQFSKIDVETAKLSLEKMMMKVLINWTGRLRGGRTISALVITQCRLYLGIVHNLKSNSRDIRIREKNIEEEADDELCDEEFSKASGDAGEKGGESS